MCRPVPAADLQAGSHRDCVRPHQKSSQNRAPLAMNAYNLTAAPKGSSPMGGSRSTMGLTEFASAGCDSLAFAASEHSSERSACPVSPPSQQPPDLTAAQFEPCGLARGARACVNARALARPGRLRSVSRPVRYALVAKIKWDGPANLRAYSRLSSGTEGRRGT